MVVEWLDCYTIGVPKIDSDHKQLVDIFNELKEAVANSRALSILESTLSKLADHIANHFSSEEEVMRRIGYPSLDEHRQQHDMIIQKFSQIVYEFETKQAIVTVDTLRLLEEWVLTHTLEQDLAIGEYIRRRPPSVRARLAGFGTTPADRPLGPLPPEPERGPSHGP